MFNIDAQSKTMTIKSNAHRKQLINQMITTGEHLELIDKLFNAESYEEFESVMMELFKQKMIKSMGTKLWNAIENKTVHKDRFINEYEGTLDRSVVSFLVMMDV